MTIEELKEKFHTDLFNFMCEWYADNVSSPIPDRPYHDNEAELDAAWPTVAAFALEFQLNDMKQVIKQESK